jgi:hypothetical protein
MFRAEAPFEGVVARSPKGQTERFSMFSNGFELFVEVGGRRIPEYGHCGKTFVEGRRAHRYEIKFKNSRAERVLAVPTVDGLNVIDGNPHTDSSPGYVVQPYCSGVIGVQVWAEKRVVQPPAQEVHIHHWPPYSWPPPKPFYPDTTIIYRSTADSGRYMCGVGSLIHAHGPTGPVGAKGTPGVPGVDFPGVSTSITDHSTLCCSNMASSQAPEFNLGTGYGAAAVDVVSQTHFEKGLWLAMMEIYYSDAEGLAKDGITVSKAPSLAVFPQAFGSFCKPPPY